MSDSDLLAEIQFIDWKNILQAGRELNFEDGWYQPCSAATLFFLEWQAGVAEI